ncbi:MAG: helix-turn-helix domain-containing protein [archaeon]|nr:helix-turn-helix domain-containing protein [archaeon]MCP8320080.1 helix-turn-helix domain-containing protein [archaeon]
METVSRRVKGIYSVIASPNRLEILRILNAKGPLSYSDLKTLAGFKSKKESGKFAYHLRKLVKQALVSLNRGERKYAISSLGRLLLNLTRQIEEQSMLESGKFYVRTSRQTIEEFNPDKILQSLIREAGMPVELAQRITNEIEARISKFQATYLTAPLIREIVNVLLIEHGYEEYRHKLTRLGLPVFDVTELMNKASRAREGLDVVLGQTAKSVFSEYLLLTQLPRDVSDAHLFGDIHLSDIGCWGLMPDALFMDLSSLNNNGIKLGKLSTMPRLGPPNNIEEAMNELIILTSFLSLEVASEIAYENFLNYIGEYSKGKSHKELKEAILRALFLISSTLTISYNKPKIAIHIDPYSSNLEAELNYAIMLATLDAYKDYSDSIPLPQIGLVVLLDKGSDSELIKRVASIVNSGGCISISTQHDLIRSYSGLKKSPSATEHQINSISLIHSLSLNLPRLSYESNRDETYFRAKMAMLLQLSISALAKRRKIVGEVINKGLLPILAQNQNIISIDYMPAIINLVGLNESIMNLTDEKTTQQEKKAITEKVIGTAIKFADEKARKLEEKTGIAILQSDSAERFYNLDLEKYGKSIVITKDGKNAYSQIPYIQDTDLYNENLINELSYLSRNLNGGFSTIINIPTKASADFVEKTILEAIGRLDHFKFNKKITICKNCGAKFSIEVERCKVCKSTALAHYSTA